MSDIMDLEIKRPSREASEDERLIEESKLFQERLIGDFLRTVPASFRHAARELEFDKVFLAHLRIAHSSLGKQALVKELAPKTDPLAIDRSLTEIREMRMFLIAGENLRFGG